MDNIRYLVVSVDPKAPSMEDPEDTEIEIQAPVPCKDAEEVLAAIRNVESLEREWSVWEAVEGRFHRRSVNFRDRIVG